MEETSASEKPALTLRELEMRYFHDEDGSLVLKVRLPAEIGAVLIKALDAAMNDSAVPTFPRKVRRVKPGEGG